MIRFRKLKLAMAILMPLLILLTCLGLPGYAANIGDHQKHETVYAYLDHDGMVLKQSVVNRINYSGVGRVEDYGEYTSIKALNFNLLPSVSGSRVIWDVPKHKPGVLFYEGVTSRELPVKVSISYFLNGYPVKGGDLAGREGKVAIKIKLENRLREVKRIEYKDSQGKMAQKLEEIYVPLMVQVTIPVDLKLFHYIESEDDAVKLVSGDTMTVSFGAFPFPEEELSLELEGKDIELEPITLAVIPMMPTIPEVEMEDDLDSLYSGVKSLNKAVSELEDMKGSLNDVAKLVDGVDELNRGGKKLADSSEELLEGIWKYVKGAGKISGGIGEISNGLSQLDRGCWQLYRGASEIPENVSNLAGGLTAIAAASGGLADGLGELKDYAIADEAIEGAKGAIDLASMLLEQSGSGELSGQLLGIKGLLDLLKGQQEAIRELSIGANQLQGGLDGLSAGIPELIVGLNELPPVIKQIAESTTKLAAGADELHDGARELAGSGRKLYRGTAEYLEGIGELSGGLVELNDGMLEMDREVGRLKDINMSDAEGKSLDDIEYSLQESLEELRLGKSTTDQMRTLAERYVSFMDNQHNKESSVQFIMKTKAIEHKLTADNSIGDKEKPKKNFWQKLKELFIFC